MPLFRGKWTARVEQDFEVEAGSEDEARELMEGRMEISDVTEMIEIEIADIEEVDSF